MQALEFEFARRAHALEANEQTVDQLLTETVQTVQVRVGAEGKVARTGLTGFAVELADASADHVAHLRRRIEDPGRLEITRPESRNHIAFGFGPHFCLGASLARYEGQIAFQTLAERYPTVFS